MGGRYATAAPRVGVLGPVVVFDGDTAIPITSGRARSLLVALVLAHPRTLTATSLVGDAWGDRPPQNPNGALQTQISRLRRALGTITIVGSAAGYRLAVDGPVSDLAVAESVSRSGDTPAGAAGQALSAWRGDPGSDLPPGDLRDHLSHRASRAYRAVREQDWHERLGTDPTGVATELADARRSRPLDEHLAALHMRAQVTAGNPNAALRIHARIAEQLAESLGADPGPELAAAHSAALTYAPLPHTPAPPADAFVADPGVTTELAAAIADSPVVTLLGPGGIGKTRLITEYITAHRPPNVFIDLSAARHPLDVTAALAVALGRGALPEQDVSTSASPDSPAAVVARLSPAGAVVVLDTCEHLAPFVADVVAEVRARRGDLTLVATSQTPLGVPDERIVVVGGLSTASGAALVTARARRLRGDAHLDPDLLRELCVRLDGSPLALELAAAQLRYLTLADVVARLDARFELLTVPGNRRHQRIDEVVAAACDLLPPTARHALDVLAQFPGDIRADDALRLHGVGLPDLAHLCDRSLATVIDRADGVTRYRLTETVREFTRTALSATPERRDHVHRAFVSWAEEVVTQSMDDVVGGRVIAAAARLDESNEPVLAALADPATARLPGAVARLLPVSLWRLVRTGGYPDAERFALAAVAHPGGPDSLLGLACAAAYLLAHGRARDAARARTLVRRRIPDTGVPGPAGLALELLVGAPAAVPRTLATAARSSDHTLAALAEIVRSDLAEFAAAVRLSRRCALRALVAAERSRHPWLIAVARQRLGRGHVLNGDPACAAALFARSADDFAAIGFADESCGVRIHQALALSATHPGAASELLEACLAESGDSRRPHIATAHMGLAQLHLGTNPHVARGSADIAIDIIGPPHDGHSAYLHGVRAVILDRTGAHVAARLAADALRVSLSYLVSIPTVNLPALAAAAAAIALVDGRAGDDRWMCAARGAHYRRDFPVIDLGVGPSASRRSLLHLLR